VLYEVINPSDGITFRTDDTKIAIALATLLGEGQYGLEDENGNGDYPTMFLFMDEEQINERLKPHFNSTKEMFDYVKANVDDFIKAIDSLATVDIAGRTDYEKALEHIKDEKDREKYKEWFNDKHRSSMNNIYGYALTLRKRFLNPKKENDH
jgi:hypothetical protein